MTELTLRLHPGERSRRLIRAVQITGLILLLALVVGVSLDAVNTGLGLPGGLLIAAGAAAFLFVDAKRNTRTRVRLTPDHLEVLDSNGTQHSFDLSQIEAFGWTSGGEKFPLFVLYLNEPVFGHSRVTIDRPLEDEESLTQVLEKAGAKNHGEIRNARNPA